MRKKVGCNFYSVIYLVRVPNAIYQEKIFLEFESWCPKIILKDATRGGVQVWYFVSRDFRKFDPTYPVICFFHVLRRGVACTQIDYLVFGVRIESMRIFSPQLLTGFWGENRIYRDILTPIYKGQIIWFLGENRIYGDILTPVYTQDSGVRIE